VALQPSGHCLNRDCGGKLWWIAVDTATDAGEGNASQAMGRGELKRALIAGCEPPRFIVRASAPHRSDGVNDKLGREQKPRCEFRIADAAASEAATSLDERRARSAMNRTIHTAAAQ